MYGLFCLKVLNTLNMNIIEMQCRMVLVSKNVQIFNVKIGEENLTIKFKYNIES